MIDLETFIIADTHFGHENIGKFEPVRLSEAERVGYRDQDRFLIDRWNNAVGPEDTVLHLGDFCLKRSPRDYLKKLNGSKMLLPGNHDKGSTAFHLSQGWIEVIDAVRLQLDDPQERNALEQSIVTSIAPNRLAHSLVNCLITDIGGQRIMFSHFPVFDDNPHDAKFEPVRLVLEEIFLMTGCALNVHGHIHSKSAKESFCINASIEKTDFKPVRLKELLC
ncbi:MAG TPA: hypothetical protein ENL02_00835 [Epsilonproteobacteria bacterium]|nr:hypothetical protein [Campylobacterota bacterium]